MYSVLLHDKRLGGNTPIWVDTCCFTVKEDDPIDRVLSWINGVHLQSPGTKIEDLSILCHGYSSNGVGGHGLQLSKDGVYLSNVNKWSAIQGKVKWIFIYACGVATVDPRVLPASKGDGRHLCMRLAAVTGATVIAPEKTQYYNQRLIHPMITSFGRLRKYKSTGPFGSPDVIDFGPWEGPVYYFTPYGVVVRIA